MPARQTRPYALARLLAPGGAAFDAVVVGDEAAALADLDVSVTGIDLMLGDWTAACDRLAVALDDEARWSAVARPLDGLRALAPYTPGQLFQSGANYKTHVVQLMVAAATEQGATDLDEVRERATALMTERATTGTPYVFIGLPSSVGGPDDDVVLPDIGVQHDWELELGVVIGAEAFRVHRDDAYAHVAGYVVVNDLTTRDRVFRPDMPALGTDWLAGKNAPGFLPLGPWLVPASFVPDPMDLRITLRLNGDTMQDETTNDMIFDVPRLIEHVSAITPMRPGDLLLTGSPAGNGAHFGRYLRPGDEMVSTITGLGTQHTRCVAP